MMEIVKVSSSAIGIIQQLAQVAFPETYKSILTPEQISYMMNMMYSTASLNAQFADGQVFFIAYSNNQPIGFISVEHQDANYVHIHKLYVLPELQHKGAGALLFSRAVEWGVKQVCGDAVVELNVNRNNTAISFYEKMGMEIARTEDNDIGNGFFMNDYVMRMEIAEE